MVTGKRINQRAVGAKVLSPPCGIAGTRRNRGIEQVDRDCFFAGGQGTAPSERAAGRTRFGRIYRGLCRTPTCPRRSRPFTTPPAQAGQSNPFARGHLPGTLCRQILQAGRCDAHQLTWPNGGCSRDGPCLPKQTHPWKTLPCAAGTPWLLPFPDGSSRSSTSAPVRNRKSR